MAKYLFKIVSIGSAGVGKTSLIRRFAQGKFQKNYLPTLGVDITTKEIQIQDIIVKLMCVDTAGQEYFGKLRGNYYRGANGCLLIFDLTRGSSFKDCPGWLNEFRMHVMEHEEIPLILLGNKSDLISQGAGEVSSDDIKEFCDREGLSYYETSAKRGMNVENAFQELASRILNLYLGNRN
ncbi:MAG: Rab family GTPase [Candidatus Hodarchaeota archaeon]